MINAILKFPVANGNRADVIRTLRSLIEPTQVERGCISCRLYRDINDPAVLTWVEEWESRADLDRHVSSPQYKKLLAALEMCTSQPEVRFETVVETEGLKLIETARSSHL